MIDSFSGEYRWLSNMYCCSIILDDKIWKSSEHYYQAKKTLDITKQEYIRNIELPYTTKREGKKLTLRDDWDSVKLDIMERVVKAKFTQNEELKMKLLNTRDIELVEGNYWNDTFWGVCNGTGSNHLGKILMKVRDELKEV